MKKNEIVFRLFCKENIFSFLFLYQTINHFANTIIKKEKTRKNQKIKILFMKDRKEMSYFLMKT